MILAKKQVKALPTEFVANDVDDDASRSSLVDRHASVEITAK